MRVISRVGQPFYKFSLERQEFKKGETIDGFTIPFNIFDSIDGLFRRFGLWQSSRGVCLPGKNHQPFVIGYYTMQNCAPVLVGDTVLGKTVLESECEYLDRFRLWECRVEYGEPPKPKAEAQEIDLLNSYADTDEALAESLVNLVTGLFNEVLPACICPANAPLNTTPAAVLFESAKSRAQQDIAQKIKELREKLWQ